MTGDRSAFERDAVIAYMLTAAPEGIGTTKIAECSREASGGLDHLLAEDGRCEAEGYAREQTAGWLYAEAQPGTVPVFLCAAHQSSHFASSASDCEGLGTQQRLLGYGLAP
jgi:hypothetical protein